MPARQRSQRPQPKCTSTATRSPMAYSSTPGPSLTTVPMYSWPGVKFLLNGRPPSISAGGPRVMMRMSPSQKAMASTRTSTSAGPGCGTGFSASLSWPGSSSTQARIVAGMAKLVFSTAVFMTVRVPAAVKA